MSYWIIPESGIPVSRTTVKHVTYLETYTNASKQKFEVYEKSIREGFHEKYIVEAFTGPNRTKLTMEMGA